MFRSLRSSFMMRHNSHNQRMLLYYSAYAWGMPFVWILITVGAEKFEPLPKGWNPRMGSTGTCFFVSTYKCIFDYFIRIKLLFRSINSILSILFCFDSSQAISTGEIILCSFYCQPDFMLS